MSEYNIIIIKPNKLIIDQSITRQEVVEIIKPLIEFRSVTISVMMDEICEEIGLTGELVGSTALCMENNDFIYQLCYLSLKDNDKEDDEEMINGLASYLTMDSQSVYGNCVLICSKILETGICATHDINIDDLVNLLYKKINHMGIRIDTSGEVSEVEFNKQNMDSVFGLSDYKYLELPFLKFNLIMYVREGSTDTINKKATLLFGSKKILGDVIVLSKSSENEYIDLDLALFKKMLIVAEGSLDNRVLTESEKDDDEKVDGLPIIKNRHRILHNRYNNYVKMCHFCKIVSDSTNNVCSGCYRMRYHSEECQKNDWKKHRIECLHNVKPVNG